MPAAPPALATSDPGSFAMRTITERKPRIIQQVIETNHLSLRGREGLQELAAGIGDGAVSGPFSSRRWTPGSFDHEEQEAWEQEIARHAGRRWLELPWYFAQAYFYLRLLIAFGYYEASSCRADPFQALKDEELAGTRGALALSRQIACLLEGIGSEAPALEFLLFSSLWGNRVDLGCFELDESRRREVLSHDRESLVVDHSAPVCAALAGARRIDMILDNAGSELACDLLLAARLLSGEPVAASGARSITLHVKRSPFFVSDAMDKDVRATIAAFSSDGDAPLCRLGRLLENSLAAGRLSIRDHWFWNGPRHFTCLPTELREQLSSADLVVIKGDANYRRLLEDRKWDSWTSMDRITDYFPAGFACLRTMKSEIVVDVPAAMAERLRAVDPEWLTNGRRGLVRLCSPGRRGS
jgi:uncharacterized protein with ATP-grasp and redox domains